MRLGWLTKLTCLGVAVLFSTAALAQFTITWYCDPDDLLDPSASVIQNPTIPGPALEGGSVYMLTLGAGGADGINLDGTLVDPTEQVVVLYGGGNAGATIGLIDEMFNQQLDGEFRQAQTLDDATYSGTEVYAIAFSGATGYNAGRFYGAGQWGISPTTHTLTGFDDTWNTVTGAAWQLNGQFVPEPTTVALMVIGLGAVVAYKKRKAASE